MTTDALKKGVELSQKIDSLKRFGVIINHAQNQLAGTVTIKIADKETVLDEDMIKAMEIGSAMEHTRAVTEFQNLKHTYTDEKATAELG